MTVTLFIVAFIALVFLPVPDCIDNERDQCSAAYTFSNGDIYDGEWADKKKQGHGTLIAAHGSKYIGEFWNGKFHGKGTFTFYDSLYVGEFSRGKFDGKGSYITADGTIRKGTWKNNRLNGQGSLLWTNGDKYVGEFKNGEKNGQGTLTIADGTITEGTWKYNQLITGQDTLIFPNGSIYVGEIKDRKITGQGTWTWANGEKYVGEFKDGKKIGQGTLTTVDGAVGEGTWKDNKLDGQGTLTWANGDKYVGDFKDNQINGWGTLTLQNGETYVGQFKDRKKNGQGTLTAADGTVTEGIWRDNEFQYANKDEADAHAGSGLGTIGSESAPSQHGATIYSSTSGSMVVGRHLSIASDVNTCTPKRVVLVWEFYDQVVNKDGETIVDGTLIDATFKSGETMINLPFITVDVFKPEYAPFALYTFVSEELAQLKLLDDGDISISLETSSHQGIDSSETFQLPKSVNLIDKSKDYCLEESSLVVSMEDSTKVTAADYDKGLEAQEAGDYEAALAELVPLAEHGNKNGLSGLEHLHSSSATSEKSEDECLIDGDTVTLSGIPSLEVFPGWPEYKSIEEGDEERWYWILNTKKYTCGMRLSYESGELYQVNGDYSRFQLANYNFSEKMLSNPQNNKIVNGKGVITITGQIMFGHNANHVTPVVLLDGVLNTQDSDDAVILQETDGDHFLSIDGENRILTIHQNKEYEWFSTLFNNLKKAQTNEDANVKIGVYDDDMLDITAHANTFSKIIDGKKAVVIKLDGDGFKKFKQMMDKQLSNPNIGYISIYIDHSNKFYIGDFLQ